MIYTPLTKLAMKIAYEAHKDQLDKGGIPYIYHPIHLAEQMDDEKSTCVALLHDVIEDTDTTIEQLSEYGFYNDIIEALSVMTHEKPLSHYDYLGYIFKVKKNSIATKVKIADLEHNSELTRLNVVNNKAKERIEKYREALEILKEVPKYWLFDEKYIVKEDGASWYKWDSHEKKWYQDGDYLRRFYDAAYNCFEIDFDELTGEYKIK